jgi:hypothetical protein
MRSIRRAHTRAAPRSVVDNVAAINLPGVTTWPCEAGECRLQGPRSFILVDLRPGTRPACDECLATRRAPCGPASRPADASGATRGPWSIITDGELIGSRAANAARIAARCALRPPSILIAASQAVGELPVATGRGGIYRVDTHSALHDQKRGPGITSAQRVPSRRKSHLEGQAERLRVSDAEWATLGEIGF